MNPVALATIANQHVADMHQHADAARLSRRARDTQPHTRRSLRRLVRLNRPEPRPSPEPAASTGR